MRIFKCLLRDTLRLLLRHWGVSLLTLLTASAVFFLVGASALLLVNLRAMVQRVEEGLVVQAYVKNVEDLQTLEPMVVAIPGVARVEKILPQQALQRLGATLEGHMQALEILGENPLPPSFEIRLVRASFAPGVVRELLGYPQVEDVVYAGKLAERMARISTFAGHFSLGVLLIAVVASSLVLYNTIRISIYSRREEISVMLLVGATPTFVSLPFVLQGMVLGVLGSLGASLLLAGAYLSFTDFIAETIPFIYVIKDPRIFYQLGLILVGGGVSLGWISSWLAVGRYVRQAMRPL
jgi:cell division transport system permease protein